MDGDNIARLIYLVVLGLAVGGWFIAENRANLGRTARQAAVWGLIFVGTIAAVGLWSDIRDDVLPRQSVIGEGTIQVPRAFDGHYYLVLELNGVPVEFIVDTGATDVVLTLDDARRIGIDPDSLVFSGSASTANGTVRTALARVDDVQLGNIRDRGLMVAVNSGEMAGSWLGMSYLRRFTKIEITGGDLILTR
ncbi:TIGR02281 family clan AA aspartic protease [Rhodobacteraceae bacterium R_SAG10]|jgi:aspartyl protease family protein|nr:TIGR02281 family clan AA aspartic protease [Rhodobacteraceae bacterium R_SAG10]